MPVSILIGAIILGGFYLKVEANKQESIERQKTLEIKQKEEEENNRLMEKWTEEEKEHRDYVNNRKKDCLELEQKERENWSNVEWHSYNIEEDSCLIAYTAKKNYYELDCKEYGTEFPSKKNNVKMEFLLKNSNFKNPPTSGFF